MPPCEGGAVYFLGTGQQQGPGAFARRGAGGDHIIQKQDPLALYGGGVCHLVSAQHIGSSGSIAGDAGLGRGVPHLFQQWHRGRSQFCSNGQRQQLYLVITAAESPQGTDRHPGEKVETVHFLLRYGHGKLPAVSMGIGAGVMELESEDTASDCIFIIPYCGPAVKVRNLFMC